MPSSVTPRTAPPRAEADRRIREHFDEFAPDYHATAFSGAGMGHLSALDLAAVRRAAEFAPPGLTLRRACDVGVGTGRISSELLRLGFELLGVDASAGMIAEATPVLPGASLVLGSLAERLPVADGHADLVTCMRVVKYLPDWPAALAELARVARTEGVVCFDLANSHSPARFGYPAGMVWPTTFRTALATIDEVGLDVLEVRPGVHLPDPVWRLAERDRAASAVRTAEAVATGVLRRHGARSWTFITRKR